MKTKPKTVNSRAMRELSQVKAAFILKGTSFNTWCNENDIDHGSATKAMLGTWSGVKGKALRSRIIEASKEKPAKPEQSMTA